MGCQIWAAALLHNLVYQIKKTSDNQGCCQISNEVFRVNVPGEQSLFLCPSLAIMIEAVKCNEDQFLCLAGKTH